ncbi:MAG TPA: alanine--glyoxylate aminotransferase family protein [Candidatus Marinimicrobia bacterium]|jgi:aspartate aminotransferase-like enzyme|nr:alanine--glyoxylate aminotransferase family protein [Candidatus Neomarinimicrobiota bacterium]HIN97435.1 alanine--glyoxylate aminotransferase family protein [Candidatus Neomarinimicrobiota bacterium]
MSTRTLAIGALQLPYNRTEQFSQITFEIIKDLKYLFGTQGDVVIFSASGTGAMEAVIFNFLDQSDKVLIVNGGVFGQRWVDLCIQHKIPFEQIILDPGQPISLEALDYRLSSQGYSTLLINAHETSTGLIYDTKAIGKLTQKYGVFFVVDAISTICADIFMMDEWHVDVSLLSTQKALALPPGLSFLALNKKAKLRLETKTCQSYYFDIKVYLANQSRGQMPFTPVIGHFMMLQERLKDIKLHGIDFFVSRHSKLAEFFRKGLQGLPLSFLPNSPSNALTAISCPEDIDAFDLVKRLAAGFNCFVAPNGGDLKHRVFRVSHLGEQNKTDIDFLINALKDTLNNFQ